MDRALLLTMAGITLGLVLVGLAYWLNPTDLNIQAVLAFSAILCMVSLARILLNRR